MNAVKVTLVAMLVAIAFSTVATAQATCEGYGHSCHAEINGTTVHLERLI